jgi:hypothetical protein
MTPIDRGAVSACQNQSNVAFIVGDHKWKYGLLRAASRALQALSSRLMNRFGTTRRQAAAILFLASDEASTSPELSCSWQAATSAEG